MIYDDLFKELEKIEQATAAEASDKRYAFNVFSILRRDDDEVGLHSKFLAELLNPKGSHGIVNFQKLFINQVLNAAVEVQEWARAPLCSSKYYDCYTEVPIKNFGRIDIVLKNEDTIIVIENKIHAYDQEHQLQRYFDACISIGYTPEKIYILYLNKYGAVVTEYGKGNLANNQFAQINYKDDVNSWLDACITEAASYPHVEQTLLQYRRLVGKLTGDTRSAKMKEAHIEMLYQKDNFKLAYDLSESFTSFQVDLQKKFWRELLEALKEKGLIFSFCNTNLESCDEQKVIPKYYQYSRGNDNYGIYYKIGSLENYDINFFVQLKNNIYFGITASLNGKQVQYPNQLNNLAREIAIVDIDLNDSGAGWHLGGNRFPKNPINFREVDSVCILINESNRKNRINQTVDEITKFVENVKNLGLIEVE